MVNDVIINFPTNLGDVVLALPVLDRMHFQYPNARVTAIVSPGVEELMSRNSFVNDVVIFNKRWIFRKKVKFALRLRGKFDLMVDLKNSLLPIALGVKFRTPFIRDFSKKMHIKDKYLSLTNHFSDKKGDASIFELTDMERDKWKKLRLKPSLFIACSSRSKVKQYPYNLLVKVVKRLVDKYPLIILGDSSESSFYKDILNLDGVVNLVGKTKFFEIFYLLKKYARLLLAVDSSILHAGSYCNIPAIGLFGPTYFGRSEPYSSKSVVMKNDILNCVPCEKSLCSSDDNCMNIDPGKIISAIGSLW